MSRDAELKQGYKNGHDAALARAIFAVVRESLEGPGGTGAVRGAHTAGKTTGAGAAGSVAGAGNRQ
jgi:hypothetical protein